MNRKLPLNIVKYFAVIILSFSLNACDSRSKHLSGSYYLIAIDLNINMMLAQKVGDNGYIGRIENTVFSAGWNKEYIVAKQHPDGNRSITNYYFVDRALDHKYAENDFAVSGPFSEVEFKAYSRKYNLPSFSYTIESLE